MLEQIQEEGFSIIEGLIEREQSQELLATLYEALDASASELDVSTEGYLSAVSRWAHPSPITDCVPQALIDRVAAQFGIKVQLKKMNIICKNAHCTGEVPFHQDIAYSPHNPYPFTTWISLNDISETGGALEVIPKSHLGPIEPAVDFWSPRYTPTEHKALQLPLKAGDAVLFDSRLWHGSGRNEDLKPRFALVLRWSYEGWSPSAKIPEIEPQFFGMWTCGEETKRLLSEGKEVEFVPLIDRWISRSKSERCQSDLHRLKILHLASEKHNGGDATGTVYKSLWHSVLEPILHD